MDREVRKGKPADPAVAQRKRAEHAELKKRLVSELVDHKVPEKQRTCPCCGLHVEEHVGNKESVEYDYVGGYWRRRVHRRETLRCTCGEYIVTAPAPDRISDKTQYSAGFVAQLVTTKCGDSIPFYRLEKQYKRVGIPISRSTMTDLFHRAGSLLAPLAQRILALVAASDVVLADETPHRMQGTDKRVYVWTFIAGDLIGYRFSTSRSGKTPVEVLGGTRGTLVVDAYTGYNRVTQPGGRERAGCLAHARRKIFEALSSAPEAQVGLDLIRDVYCVEHEAKERDLVRTDEHLAIRQARSRPIMQKLHDWLAEQKELHPPKSAMGVAVRYALSNWTALTRFLDDVAIPLDNNQSEAALRVVAQGRKAFLFVGHEEAGDNLAALYTLVRSCEAVGVNPLDYLADVLIRIQTHPADRIDDLLPHRWAPPAA